MGKSKQQKEAESLDLERQRQQVDANKWMSEFSQELAAMSKDRFAKEQAYYKENIDPALSGYAKTGFAPGEEKRLRTEDEERTARIHGQGERTTLGSMARAGFRGDAPSGALARAKVALGAGRSEARVAGQRQISQYGAETRRGAIGQMMQRAQGFNPTAPLSGVASGRPTDVRQAKFGPGFWGKLGNTAVKIGQSAVSAWNPLGGGGGGGMTQQLDQGTGGYYSYNALKQLPVSQPVR